jgi:hypothetical protein
MKVIAGNKLKLRNEIMSLSKNYTEMEFGTVIQDILIKGLILAAVNKKEPIEEVIRGFAEDVTDRFLIFSDLLLFLESGVHWR